MTGGIVLNVGANEDPANLKAMDPERVINCDIEAQDSYLDRPNKVDLLFDCTKLWPLDNDYAELVVFGDILEHLYPEEAERALREAHRVAEKLCITVPRDNRFETDEQGVLEKNGYRTHCYEWTEGVMRSLLDRTGWKVVDWKTVDYYFVPEGYFILAERDDAYAEGFTNPVIPLDPSFESISERSLGDEAAEEFDSLAAAYESREELETRTVRVPEREEPIPTMAL
jgi:hypothetical protein